jgi:amyotrophic lateral sclerosis 2 protein
LQTEKLTLLVETFRLINQEAAPADKDFCWSMDHLFPVFMYVVVRARILQLGAEIHMMEDFLDQQHLEGERGIMFTTLQAAYYQLLKESLSI